MAELLAGLGAEAELLAESAMEQRTAALWQRAIWKMLLAGAPWRSCCRQGTVGTEDCRQGRCSEELSGRCCWPGRRGGAAGRGAVAEILLPGRTIGKKMLAGGAVAELLPAAAGRHYGTKKRE